MGGAEIHLAAPDAGDCSSDEPQAVLAMSSELDWIEKKGYWLLFENRRSGRDILGRSHVTALRLAINQFNSIARRRELRARTYNKRLAVLAAGMAHESINKLL